jgi:catechol 2,3-dioxygenase-like lactoylglutathione lyase family enzyme
MRQKINLITLGVHDIRRSVKFYEEGLKWTRAKQSMDDLIIYPLGGITLTLYPVSALSDDVTIPYQSSDFSGLTFSLNAKSEAEVDAFMREAEMAGAIIVKPAQKVFWGGYSGYFKDPDGYLFEIAFNPFWKLDENDNLMFDR